MKLITDLIVLLAGPAKSAAPAMSEHSEFLDYAERESRRTLDELRAAFNAHFERALKVLTLLTGGAGAVAAYAINNWAQLSPPAQWALLTLAVCWSGIAVILATRGMRSRRIDAGGAVTAIAATYSNHAGSLVQPQSTDKTSLAMRVVRMAELNREHLQAQTLAQAVSQQTKDLRQAVVSASLAPALALCACAWAMYAI